MELIVTYLIYILGLVATVFMFLFFHTKIQLFREKREILRDLIEHDYETDKIDLEKFFNNK